MALDSTSMRKAFIILVIFSVLVFAGLAISRASSLRALASRTDYETLPVRRGDLQITVTAAGVLRADQSAVLRWQTSGSIESVNVKKGDPVSMGQILASLEQTSLPRQLILAQVDFIEAQRKLDDLLYSQTQPAQAQKAVEDAEQALEDALDSKLVQSNAMAAFVRAQKAVDTAQRNLDILLTPASQEGIDAARATLLQWEHSLELIRLDIERVQRKLQKDEDAYSPGESRDSYEAQLETLLQKVVRYQRLYEDAVARYQRLQMPPDPNDLAVAEAKLKLAQAQLSQAQSDWERVKDGPNPADIAVLQARLDDSRRTAEHLKDGPDPDEVTAARARLAAAQAALDLAHIKAPFDGVITEAAAQPGDQVLPGDVAFRLDDLSPLWIELDVSEIEVNRIREGQPVIITLDSSPGRQYNGEVVDVSAVGKISSGVASFRVKAEIRDADRASRPTMTASASIIVAEMKDVLIVPASAVRFIDGQRVVYVLRQGQPTPVHVTLGSFSSNEIQVLEGDLQPGEAVILNPDDREQGSS